MEIGNTFKNNQGCCYKIIDYVTTKNITVQFQDEHSHIVKIEKCQILRGSVKNPYHRSLHGVGYIGVGPFIAGLSKNSPHLVHYRRWAHMLKRCYVDTIQPAYNDCTVTDEWHNYQTFAKWFEENHVEGFSIDKDILVEGNREYGPTTCMFVPQWVNNLFIHQDRPDKLLVTGVTKRRNGKFRARISKYGVLHTIGTFVNLDTAEAAYLDAKWQYLIECANHPDTPERAKSRILQKANTL